MRSSITRSVAWMVTAAVVHALPAVGAASESANRGAVATQPAGVTDVGKLSRAAVELKDLSLDKPLVLDENTDYRLKNVTVAGVMDCAAITLSGRIRSVMLEGCSFGRVVSGMDGKASGIDCAGAVVNRLSASHTSFFDAEHQLANLRDGSFGRVTFANCRFSTSEMFLKQCYANNPWRSGPPVTEFANIERLELLDNEYVNTTVIIHPSVKQVIIRGEMPGLKISDPQATQVFQLAPNVSAETVPMASGGVLAMAD